MFDVIWITLNILIFLSLALLFIGLAFWSVKTKNWKFLVLALLLLLVVRWNDGDQEQDEKHAFTMGQTYRDTIKLSPFQKDNITIEYALGGFKYETWWTGVEAGIYWDNVAFSGEEPGSGGLKYTLIKRKRYAMMTIPIFSKTVTFEGTAVKVN